jgi:hypothetical protein
MEMLRLINIYIHIHTVILITLGQGGSICFCKFWRNDFRDFLISVYYLLILDNNWLTLVKRYLGYIQVHGLVFLTACFGV